MTTSVFKTSDPYQWFFPLGILLGIIGVGYWFLFQYEVLSFYPGLLHAEVMVGGFLIVIATGFLMTAIPRFTGTSSASPAEKGLIFLVSLALLGSALSVSRKGIHLFLLAQILLLCRFGFSRLKKALYSPPPSFIFVGQGLLSALAGTLLLSLADYGFVSNSWTLFGRLLLLYGVFLGFALGIGTKLIPVIMGTVVMTPVPLQPTPFNVGTLKKNEIYRFALYGLILLASFIIEAFIDMQVGRGTRALLVTWVILKHWNLHRKPASPGILSRSLWVSSLMMVLGVWPAVFFPSYALHGAHILFIGSLSLMIFSIMTRVTLSHGGHDCSLEVDSKALRLTLIFLMLALLLRLIAPFVPFYFQTLALASAAWILAAFSWISTFLVKLVKRGS